MKTKRKDKIVKDKSFDTKSEKRKKTKKVEPQTDFHTYFINGKQTKIYVYDETDLAIDEKFKNILVRQQQDNDECTDIE